MDNPPLCTPPALPTPTAPPRLRKAATLRGQQLVLRNARTDDAAFIWQLRHNAARNAYMSPTSADLADQVAWLARYAQDETQAYFLITQANSGAPLGTVRLYDAQGESFCWGSWMLVPGAPATAAMESALIVYHYALSLGFRAAHFEVHEANAPVRRFHERFGAQRTGLRNDQMQYQLPYAELMAAMTRYSRWLPHGVQIEPLPAAPGAPDAANGARDNGLLR
jgi:RimJ/RimL family protein N-acetyltransferase